MMTSPPVLGVLGVLVLLCAARLERVLIRRGLPGRAPRLERVVDEGLAVLIRLPEVRLAELRIVHEEQLPQVHLVDEVEAFLGVVTRVVLLLREPTIALEPA